MHSSERDIRPSGERFLHTAYVEHDLIISHTKWNSLKTTHHAHHPEACPSTGSGYPARLAVAVHCCMSHHSQLSLHLLPRGIRAFQILARSVRQTAPGHSPYDLKKHYIAALNGLLAVQSQFKNALRKLSQKAHCALNGTRTTYKRSEKTDNNMHR